MSLRRLATPLVALLVLLGTAACNDDPEPKFADPTDDPTTSSSAPTSDSPTSSPPGPESAEDFIRRWQALGDAMQRTGQSAEYEDLNVGCDSCDYFVAAVKDVYSAGGRIEFAGTDIKKMVEVSAARRSATYDMTIVSGETLTYAAGDPRPTRIPPERVTLRLTLTRDGPSWLVSSFSKLPE